MARIVKLPDDPEVWRDMARDGLLWEEATDGYYLASITAGLLLDCGLLHNNPETLNRLRWTARHFRIGIMLEE